MGSEKRTTEQQNEYDSKWTLAEAINKLRKHCDSAIHDLEEALHALRCVDSAMDAIPDGIDAEDIDADVFEVIAKAVRAADDEGLGTFSLRFVQDDIDRVESGLSEAVGQVDCLLAGDFSE